MSKTTSSPDEVVSASEKQQPTNSPTGEGCKKKKKEHDIQPIVHT